MLYQLSYTHHVSYAGPQTRKLVRVFSASLSSKAPRF